MTPCKIVLPCAYRFMLPKNREANMASNLDAGLPRILAAQAVSVNPHTVSMWALRGWIDPDGTRRKLTVVGHDKGDRLYRYGDVLDAERATRRSPNSRRAA